MVKLDQMKQMQALLEAKFLKQQSAILDLLQREGSLRSDLNKLERQARLNENAEYSEMQAIGADVIWKAWIGKTKGSLNLELAQVLAQKEVARAGVKASFGRKMVGEMLLRENEKAKKVSRQAKVLQDVLEQYVSNRSGGYS